MDISLLHAGLAAGMALAALPVILHLFMKQTPKHVIFPALRLIRERQKRSRKTLKVKNWLLLLARVALIALMALALARPRLYSQTKLGDQEVPTALGLVFDTSLSMGYKDKDKSRLDEAKERAAEVLKKVPDTSQVFVVDSAEPGIPVALSPAAARKRIDALTLRAAQPRTLNAAVGQAYAAIADSDRPRHEVYVLTDLARSAWDPERPIEGRDKLKKLKEQVGTYILRLSPKEPHNVAVAEAEPSSTVVAPGAPVEIRARLQSRGPATSRFAEFFIDGVKRDSKRVELAENGEAEVKFTSPLKADSGQALHQGYVKISGAPDPLDFDDARYFSFKVQPALKVLAVSDQAIDAEFVADALDPNPTTLPPGTPRSFQVERIRAAAFEERTAEALKDNACIFLLNVGELNEAAWAKLNAYVRDGGGLVVALGSRCQVASYNSPAAAQLLPTTLRKVEDPKPETTFGKVADFSQPLFSRYSKELDSLLSQVLVYHYWSVAPPEGARTLLSFADNAPALLERTFKGARTGRVLLWTTPLSRRAQRSAAGAWNEFPAPFVPGGGGWSFVYLMNQTIPYLAGSSSERLNYEAGEDVILPIDPAKRFKNYIVHSADGKTTDRLSPPATSDALVIMSPQPIGQWTVVASDNEGGKTATLGFSVNPPLAESRLASLQAADLDTIFGKEKYALADDPNDISTVVSTARIGQELFPWIMVLILLIVTAENLLANRFYREKSGQTATGAAASRARPAPVS